MPHLIGRFSTKNITGPERTLKRSKIEGYKSRFYVPGICAPNVVGYLERTLDGILRNSTTLNGHNNNFYDRFEAIPWLHHKIINAWFGGILGQFRWCEAPEMHYKLCHTHRKVFVEKYDRGWRSSKTVQNKG